MSPRITAEVLEAFLHCRYKGHLTQAGQVGMSSDYEVLTAEQRAAVRQQAIEQIAARHADGEVLSTTPLTAATLKQGAAFVLDATLEDDTFSVRMFKTLLARYYRPCYQRLLKSILTGPVLYIDETEVKLRTGKGYVWVLATAEQAVYLYRPTREGDFLPGLLKGFRGVLVSDFYAAYDALPCPQQKCLIHLLRDMNQELLNNPFDTELQSITGPFGTLLRAAVEEIDLHGLKARHLGRHERAADRFFDDLAARSFGSEAAEALRARLLKYRDKLFTFLRHDGVAWNNNAAENAIKRFAYYREGTVGCLKEPGLADYLVLLSIYQTCRYRGVPADLTHLVNCDDVIRMEGGGRLGLTEEPQTVSRIRQQIPTEDLHGRPATQFGVHRLVDHPHPAAADLPHRPVVPIGSKRILRPTRRRFRKGAVRIGRGRRPQTHRPADRKDDQGDRTKSPVI
jgi:hypothetical protein